AVSRAPPARSPLPRSRRRAPRGGGGVAMTRARWIIGGLVGVSALVVAGESLVAYIAGGSVVGVAAVVVLAGLLIVGFVSLGGAPTGRRGCWRCSGVRCPACT